MLRVMWTSHVMPQRREFHNWQIFMFHTICLKFLKTCKMRRYVLSWWWGRWWKEMFWVFQQALPFHFRIFGHPSSLQSHYTIMHTSISRNRFRVRFAICCIRTRWYLSHLSFTGEWFSKTAFWRACCELWASTTPQEPLEKPETAELQEHREQHAAQRMRLI